MSYLPMLSHQQLLYMLAVSFISRVPRTFLPGARSSRLRDRRKEEREDMVKRAFLDDMTNECVLLCSLLGKESTAYVVFWDPDMLPYVCEGPLLPASTASSDHPGSLINTDKKEAIQSAHDKEISLSYKKDSIMESELHEDASRVEEAPYKISYIDEKQRDTLPYNDKIKCTSSYINDDDELPCGLDVDAGTLACVACGILGYPFMSIVQPSGRVINEIVATDAAIHKRIENIPNTGMKNTVSACGELNSEAQALHNEHETADADSKLQNVVTHHQMELTSCCVAGENISHLSDYLGIPGSPSVVSFGGMNDHPTIPLEAYKHDIPINRSDGKHCLNGLEECEETLKDISDSFDGHLNVSSIFHKENPTIQNKLSDAVAENNDDLVRRWNTSDPFLRPRTFCLQHAAEVQELLQYKGGSKILIICHSDYLKIKAHAMSFAEEIGAQYNYGDIPIGNASSLDLDLINLSIDDEEHEKFVDDWTSKMGLNLRHCVKLRRQSSSKQERLSLALNELFCDPIPLSVPSSLRWQSKRTRTRRKGSSSNLCRLQDGVHKKDGLTVRNTHDAPLLKDSFSTGHEGKSSDVVNPIKPCGCPKSKSSDADKLHSRNEDMVDDNTESIDKERVLSGTITGTCLEYRNEIDGLHCVSSQSCGDYEACKESGELLNIETSKKVNSALVIDFPITTNLHDEDYGQIELQPRGLNGAVDVCDSVKDTSSAFGCSKAYPDIPCAYACSLDEVAAKSKDKHGDKVLVFEPTISARVMDKSEISHQFQKKAKVQGDAPDDDMEKQPTAPSSNVASCGMHQRISDAMDVVRTCDTSESGKHTAAGSDIPENYQCVGIDNRQSEVESQYFDVGSSIKCYVRRKRCTGKSGFVPKSSKSACNHQRIPTIEVDPLEVDINSMERDDEHSNFMDTKSSERCVNKRKREVDHLAIQHHDFGGFVRGPCEGLRARIGRDSYKEQDIIEGRAASRNLPNRSKVVVAQSKKGQGNGVYGCDLEGCHMRFRTKEELLLHKRNRCTFEGCGKRFSKHRYTMRHQRVHEDDRPLKCPWKGCTMSFKWAWARTEHLRVHTGERPYKCKVIGCGLTFRFVSDFSRHRRKTGHSVNSSSS